MNKLFLLVLVLGLCGGTLATAAPVYLGIFSGNDHVGDVQAAILAATGQEVNISLFDKSDSGSGLTAFTPIPWAGALDGTWDVVDPSVVISYVTVKASNDFTLYSYNPAVNSGTWSTANLLNKNGVQQELSHLSLWTTASASQVPEPTSVLLMGAGVTALGVLGRWRSRRNQSSEQVGSAL